MDKIFPLFYVFTQKYFLKTWPKLCPVPFLSTDSDSSALRPAPSDDNIS